ncbi:lipopolysaccharide assembly protein LapB [Thiomicrospira sp. ALE5]|uniref:tetratricopeptide repeat protein n=1 Tax=Thiomicrospira sp. ALE5 TaxID=748650 RepID=UPI001F426DD5|nr:tetratricopeptide repeat protein [Thiomicrospira sp. ALE5]
MPNDLSYYASLIKSIGKDQIVDQLLSKAEELSKEGEFHLASHYYLSAHRVNHLLDLPTHDEESLLTLAINSSIDANQLSMALKLLKEEQKTLYDPAQALLHYQQIASVYQMLGQYKQAEQALQHSLDSMQKLSKGLNTAKLHFKIAQMAFKQGDDLRSEAHLKDAYLQSKKINDPMLQADIAYLQAAILIKQAKFDLALPLSTESLKHHQAQTEQNSPGKQLVIAERQVQLANIYRGLEQFDKAESLYSQAAKTTESLLGKKHDHYAKVLEEELKMLFRQGKYQKAEQLIAQYQQQNIPIFKRNLRYGYEYP